jgi:mRNA interferase MazF
MIKGNVVLVPFPFDDLMTVKVRPAICLTEPIGSYRHLILAFITSRIHTDLPDTDLVVPSTHPDFLMTGLQVSSIVRLHRVMTVRASLIRRKLGALSPTLQAEVDERLRRIFDL